MTTVAPTHVSFERILIPTDFSDASDRALDYAKSIATYFNSELFLVHVNPPFNPVVPPEGAWVDEGEILQKVQEQLEQGGAALRSEGFRAKAVTATGKLQDEILSLVKHDGIELIVLGSHGKSGLKRLLFGSDSEAILRNVFCPVLTLGPAVMRSKAWPPEDVVCATTLNPDSAHIAAYAYMLARQFGASFALCHVLEPTGGAHAQNWGLFEEALMRCLPPEVEIKPPLQGLLFSYKPGTEVAGFANQRNADLVVMGSHTASAFATHLPQGTSPRVFGEATCPLMTLHES